MSARSRAVLGGAAMALSIGTALLLLLMLTLVLVGRTEIEPGDLASTAVVAGIYGFVGLIFGRRQRIWHWAFGPAAMLPWLLLHVVMLATEPQMRKDAWQGLLILLIVGASFTLCGWAAHRAAHPRREIASEFE